VEEAVFVLYIRHALHAYTSPPLLPAGERPRAMVAIDGMRVVEEEDDGKGVGVVVIRQYDPSKDREGTEAVDRDCEVGPAARGMSLHADLLGDPVARIRHSPDYLMLVRTVCPHHQLRNVCAAMPRPGSTYVSAAGGGLLFSQLCLIRT
jgi:hypothetical protein